MNNYLRKLNKIHDKILSFISSIDDIKKRIYDKIQQFLNKKIILLNKIESLIDLKINTLEIQKKSNENNFVMVSEQNNFPDKIVKNSDDMENILISSESFYLSIKNNTNLESDNSRKIFKITNFEEALCKKSMLRLKHFLNLR